MSEDKLLDQDKIDALLKATSSDQQEQIENNENTWFDKTVFNDNDQAELTPKEKDALGEIGNISMGSAATTLSQLMDKRVYITSPEVAITGKRNFFKGFKTPFLIIKVKFSQGFDGYNVLIIKMKDAKVMADLMMGGDGTDLSDEISDMEISAAAEAMNQMIGTASTSLADLMSTSINIMPPETELVYEADKMGVNLPFNDPIVVISFRMNIEDLLDTTIMQIIDIDIARAQSKLLWSEFGNEGEDMNATPVEQEAPATEEIPDNSPQLAGEEREQPNLVEPSVPDTEVLGHSGSMHDNLPDPVQWGEEGELPKVDPQKLNLLLDIPLKVSVVLGRTKKQINEVLKMTPGAIVELETLVDEPVDILVNGKKVAQGEIVVVNENFGIKITGISSTKYRINSLASTS